MWISQLIEKRAAILHGKILYQREQHFSVFSDTVESRAHFTYSTT